ncbi:MAG: hypothetical protein D8M57_01600 [Candidatus Scalindua sp. AMX11]|nr:MAG: hypothetical protein DWQ00_15585 [Candidatus Scalindua sp.]NOG85084.1 hypothetical protein [Planctomycetota bacterium]RZV93131.1 MAG: hypothetical protein EX341_04510 [Candidatus Scalindua sp. SCAELEC01]TDE66757.1 MAG: hypothetical protein D8M57_01600 [Candidatus Scalindua sp. AMX11]GJQ58069.1 MAG: hypothetical protein SCALA701_08700 [Candidatus Scalindua sp.]
MKNVTKCISVNRKESKSEEAHKGCRPARAKSRQKRYCLRCEKKFTSEGPYNRLCDKCRLANERIASSVYSINGTSVEPKHLAEKELHKLN